MNKANNNLDIRDAYFDRIYELAVNDHEIIFISADTDAFSLRKFRNDMPKQYINIGVAEQNMVSISAGLGMMGKKVYIYSIISFTVYRCYEFIKNNICAMNVPVTIVGLGAGLSFSNDGPTHHAMQDIGLMRTLPNMNIYNPCDENSALWAADETYECKNPSFIRIDKGQYPAVYNKKSEINNGLKIIEPLTEINIISTGTITHKCKDVIKIIERNRNINIGLIDLFRIKPINQKLLLSLLMKTKIIITIEENSIIGGIGSIISNILIDNSLNDITLKKIALEDQQYFLYGDREYIYERVGLDEKSITQRIYSIISNNN